MVFTVLLSPGVARVEVEIYNLDVTTHCVKFLCPPQNRNVMAASVMLRAVRGEPQMRPGVVNINRQN
jgi:hypothetical protein